MLRLPSICHAAVLLLAVPLIPFAARAAADGPAKLEVHTEPAGGVRAVATLMIPAPPRIVQEILIDYVKWPTLFITPMRLAQLEQHGERAVTDLYIKHAFLPGERRLLCESRELPDGGLVTTLIAGDFKRYHRIWKLSPEGEGVRTRAEFELLVEVDTWAPDWLVAVELRRELETHFRILTDKAVERVKRGT